MCRASADSSDQSVVATRLRWPSKKTPGIRLIPRLRNWVDGHAMDDCGFTVCLRTACLASRHMQRLTVALGAILRCHGAWSTTSRMKLEVHVCKCYQADRGDKIRPSLVVAGCCGMLSPMSCRLRQAFLGRAGLSFGRIPCAVRRRLRRRGDSSPAPRRGRRLRWRAYSWPRGRPPRPQRTA